MYRGRESNTEVDDIWHEKEKYRGTLQSQQLQMATERSALMGITAEKEVCSLENTHFSHVVMHLSMEDIILSQLDLIWENYIVSAYDSYRLDKSCRSSHVTSVNKSSFIPRESIAGRTHILYEHNIKLCIASAGDIGFSSICYGIFTDQKQKIYLQGAIEMKNQWRKRKRSTDSAENEAKRFAKINKFSAMLHYFTECKKTDVGFISYNTKDCKDVDISCDKIEASSMPMLQSAQETCCNVKAGSKMSDDGCYFGSVLKSLVISSSPLCVTEEVFSSTFIPQSDSSVDYTKLCGSLQQKGRCKVPDDSDESLCLTNNTDSNINLHVRLSAHPCILTSHVILSDVNCVQPGERQGQNWFNWATYKRRKIQEEITITAATLQSSEKNKSSLLCTDRHCCDNDKSFLPREKTFPMRLNYPRRLEKQHFPYDINFSIFAASLLGTSKNDLSFFHSAGLQSTSQTESSHELMDESLSLKHKAEVEVSFGTENINTITGRAHLDCKTALNKHDFCFPSHFHNGVDIEQSEKETSGNNVDFNTEATFSEQVLCAERVLKISLEESKSCKSEEMYYSLRNEMFYKSRYRQNNMTTMEDKPPECKSKWQNIKQQHKHQYSTKDTEDKQSNEEIPSMPINSDGIHHPTIKNSSIYEDIIEDAEVDMNLNHLDGMEEEKQQDVPSNGRPLTSICKETIVYENSKQECDLIDASLLVRKKNTDFSSEGNKVLLNTDFEMKVQFDLVLEELKMFHTIEEEKVEHFEVGQGQENRLEHTCINTKDLPGQFKENFPSKEVMAGGDSEVIVAKNDYVCNKKITTEVGEQEVPQECMSTYLGEEESLYSADNIDLYFTEVIPNFLSWTPDFLKSSSREANITSDTEKAVTFSHGIGRVTPLKTRTGPLRIGLSRKAKIKQLHPYLR
ncbi:RAD51-associated protein 2 [Leptodactylus fuscus]